MPDLHENVLKTLQFNGYWSHPESILLAMCLDERDDVREKGLEKIQTIRNDEAAGTRTYEAEIRRFEVPPNINFCAKTYDELINFETVGIEFTSPPILNDYTIGNSNYIHKSFAACKHSGILCTTRIEIMSSSLVLLLDLFEYN